jgi:hypothetical protein
MAAPVNAPVQYGPRTAAVVTYLLHYQLLPEDRLAELMSDLFGVRIAAATRSWYRSGRKFTLPCAVACPVIRIVLMRTV